MGLNGRVSALALAHKTRGLDVQRGGRGDKWTMGILVNIPAAPSNLRDRATFAVQHERQGRRNHRRRQANQASLAVFTVFGCRCFMQVRCSESKSQTRGSASLCTRDRLHFHLRMRRCYDLSMGPGGKRCQQRQPLSPPRN
jgi:hypothetical protein